MKKKWNPYTINSNSPTTNIWIAFGNLNEENGTENISETDEIRKISRKTRKIQQNNYLSGKN